MNKRDSFFVVIQTFCHSLQYRPFTLWLYHENHMDIHFGIPIALKIRFACDVYSRIVCANIYSIVSFITLTQIIILIY